MKLPFLALFLLAASFQSLALTALAPPAGASDVNSAHAPFSQVQFETFSREFQDWKKKAKWELKNPESHFDIVHHSEVRSMKLPDAVHALRVRYWEKGKTDGKTPLDVTGGAYREFTGFEKDGGFKIIKDSGFFEPECGVNDHDYEILEPVLVESRALVRLVEKTHHIGCVGEKDSEKESLLLFDPTQNYAQVAEIPLRSSDEQGTQTFASISGRGGVGDPTGVQDSWYEILIQQATFKSAHDKGKLTQEVLGWNKNKTLLETRSVK